MNRTIAMVLVVGVLGTAVLIGLGSWQIQRLGWKEAAIADIEGRIGAAPVAIPAELSEEEHEYLPVRATGLFLPGELHVLTSASGEGPGYRVIAPFQTSQGRRVLVDRGFVPEVRKDRRLPIGPAEIEGNLLWPDETDGFTPDPNLERNIWFARDEATMAEALGTDPVMVVLRTSSLLDGPRPQPVSVDLPNDHLQYAITWFGLALVWAGMTIGYIWRRRKSS